MKKILILFFTTIGRIFTKTAARVFINLFTKPPGRAFREPHLALKAAAAETTIMVSSYAFDESKTGVRTYIWGTGNKTVLLLHGWAGSAVDFGAMVNMLTEEGYRVISFDQPAHGFSEGKNTNLIQWIYIIRQFLRLYDISIVIAHSLGGLAATIALAREQKKVSHHILIAPLISSIWAFEDAFRQLRIGEPVSTLVPQMVLNNYKEDVRTLDLPTHISNVQAEQVLLIYDTTDVVISVPQTERFLHEHPEVQVCKITAEGHYRIIRDEEVLLRIKNSLSS